jgi:hypothetical protein
VVLVVVAMEVDKVHHCSNTVDTLVKEVDKRAKKNHEQLLLVVVVVSGQANHRKCRRRRRRHGCS